MSKVELVYGQSRDEMRWDTLIEAMEAKHPPQVGDVIYIGEKKSPDVRDFVSADNVLGDISTAADDFAGEYAEGFTDVDDEAKEELEALLRGWAEKHLDADFYQVENIREYVLTKSDIHEYDSGCSDNPRDGSDWMN